MDNVARNNNVLCGEEASPKHRMNDTILLLQRQHDGRDDDDDDDGDEDNSNHPRQRYRLRE